MEIESSKQQHDSSSAKGEALNDWLPITKSRHAKWWYSAFHNVTAMVGAGILGLPFAMSQLGCYQVFSMPVFDMIESFLVKQMKFKPSWILRFLTRNIYVAFTMLVGITFPFFGGLLGFFGGFCFAPTSYYIPCIIWLKLYKPRRFSLSWFANWSCIVVGLILTLLGPIGGMVEISKQHHSSSAANAEALNDWLPITKSRHAKWWYSAFHNVTAMVGAGILGLPFAMSQLGCYQVFSMPVFDMMESFLVKQMKFKPSLFLRFVTRNIYVGEYVFRSVLDTNTLNKLNFFNMSSYEIYFQVITLFLDAAFTMFVGITFPFFGGLLGFFGGFCFAPTSFYIPCFIWLKLYKPKRFSLSWFTNWSCIIVGLILTVLGPIGGMVSLIQSARTFQFFS
ncbi:hypothetical protein GQ457_06G036530 [Hibiscus cannabinus]